MVSSQACFLNQLSMVFLVVGLVLLAVAFSTNVENLSRSPTGRASSSSFSFGLGGVGGTSSLFPLMARSMPAQYFRELAFSRFQASGLLKSCFCQRDSDLMVWIWSASSRTLPRPTALFLP